MFEGNRVVVGIPSGRKRYLQVLLPYLLDARASMVDEVQLWVNTDNEDDLAFFVDVEKQFAPRIVRVTVPNKLRPGVYNAQRKHVQYNDTICHFYRATVDLNTIYIKLDDDMVYVHPDFFTNLLTELWREKDRCYLFIANMFNVAITTKLYQNAGVIGTDHGVCTGDLRCPVACTDGKFAVFMHEEFLKLYQADELNKLCFDSYDIKGRQRIGAIAYTGKTFDRFHGVVDSSDEKYITQELNKIWLEPIRLVGDALISHFASAHQVAELEDNSNVLERYREICIKETGRVL